MTTARDDRLQALFAAAEQEFDGSAFRSDVMARIDGQRRRTVVTWSLLSLVAIILLIAMATPFIEALRLANQFLPVSLVDIETDWLRQAVSPVNSVAAAVAVAAVAVQMFYRKIFR